MAFWRTATWDEPKEAGPSTDEERVRRGFWPKAKRVAGTDRPWLGTSPAVAMNRLPDDALAEARIGLAGPLVGSVGCPGGSALQGGRWWWSGRWSRPTC